MGFIQKAERPTSCLSITPFLRSLHKCRTTKDLKHILVQLIVTGLLKDHLAVRELVTLCSRIGNLEYAASVLKQVNDCNPFVWNAVVRGYEQSHNPRKSIEIYYQMLHNHVYPDKFTFPFVLKACTGARALKEGEQIHCRVLKSPLSLDLFVQGSLILMYASCRKINAARALFDAMPHRNLISWNVMIDGYVKHGDIDAACKLFDQMLERDLFSWNVMIDGFAKCGKVDYARRLFDDMPKSDIVSWNSMIDGYVKCGNMGSARELFDLMPVKDEVTWGIMLNGYAKCDRIEMAHSWFEKLPYKNPITWNCLINGYVKCDDKMASHKLFELMPCRNLTSWNLIVDAYAKCGEIELACQLFNIMPVKDVVSWNIILDGHARLGRMEVTRELFNTMPCRDVVSWNTMMSAYKQNGQPKETIKLYRDMHLIGEKPDCFTLSTVLSAIADLGFFVQGRWIHAYVDRNQFPLDGAIGVALIDMYSKCGYVDIAKWIFDIVPQKNKDHWNAMLSGLAAHGSGSLAVSLFGEMERANVRPDDITFIAVLSACSHAGLVHEGHLYFEYMRVKYGITPKIQHYGCMVDLLSRAGHLEAAVTLVSNMPMRSNDIVWRALLGACRNHGNVEIAEHAARHLIELVPQDSSSYVLLSNIYRYKGQCQSARDMWKIMKERGAVKTPGCSSIELQGVLHEFTVGDTSHPQIFEIYLLLSSMAEGFMLAGYVPSIKHSLFDTDVTALAPL